MPNSTYAKSQTRQRRHHRSGPLVTKRYLRAIIGSPEKKWFNVNQGSPNGMGVSTITGDIYPLDQVAQGTGDNNRIGDTISLQSIQMRLDLARTTADGVLRVILFRWMQRATPTVANILEAPLFATQQYQQPINKNYGKSIKVLFDKTYTLATGQTQLQTDKIYRKAKYQTEFDSGTAESMNGTYLLFIGSPINVASPTAAQFPVYSFTSRITYTDV